MTSNISTKLMLKFAKQNEMFAWKVFPIALKCYTDVGIAMLVCGIELIRKILYDGDY